MLIRDTNIININLNPNAFAYKILRKLNWDSNIDLAMILKTIIQTYAQYQVRLLLRLNSQILAMAIQTA